MTEVFHEGGSFLPPEIAELMLPTNCGGELLPLAEGVENTLVDGVWKPGEGIPMKKPEPFDMETGWQNL